MLLREGHGRAACGADVVVASVATHGRPGTARLLAGLEIVPPAAVAIGDTLAERLDLDAVLARKPQVALVDGLAHRNPPGPGRATPMAGGRRAAGGRGRRGSPPSVSGRSILSLTWWRSIAGVPALLTVPDPVLLDADEIELVDVAPEALRDRMARGHVSACPGGPGRRCASWCSIGPLHALRQLALGWLAATLAQQRQRVPVPLAVVATPGRPGSGSWSRCPAAQKARR